MIVFKVCHEVAPDSDFRKGKSWSEWKVDYLKRHLNHKRHNESRSALTQKRNLEAKGGSFSLFTAMSSAEDSKFLTTPPSEVNMLIEGVVLSVLLNSSILSCQVIKKSYVKIH